MQRVFNSLGGIRQISAHRHQYIARVDQQLVLAGFALVVTDVNRQLRLIILRQLRLSQPRRRALDAHAFTRQQVADEALAQLQIAQCVAGGRIEQAGAEAQLAAGGDGRCGVQCDSHFPGHDVDATQSPQQRHDCTAIFGNGEHWRLNALLQQNRRQRANDDARCAQRDDRRVLLIKLTQCRAKLQVATVAVFHTSGQPVNQRLGIQLLNTSRRRQRAFAENDNRRGLDVGRAHQPCHRSPGTMISEKYGDDIGSTSASGTIF